MKLVHDKPPFLKVFLFTILVGAVIGVSSLWAFSSGISLLASIGAGVAFAVTCGIASTCSDLTRKLHLFAIVILGGFVGGAAWWAISKPTVPVIVSMFARAGFAALAVLGESSLLLGRKR